MKCDWCLEEFDELEAGPICQPCLDHFQADDAQRDEELRQMNEAFDAEFGDENEDG